MKITMTITRNTLTTEEKQDLLLYCERAAIRTWTENRNGQAQVKVQRSKTWITMDITWTPTWIMNEVDFLKAYNRKLWKLPEWNDDDTMEMEWSL